MDSREAPACGSAKRTIAPASAFGTAARSSAVIMRRRYQVAARAPTATLATRLTSIPPMANPAASSATPKRKRATGWMTPPTMTDGTIVL
jgi:hypothetical protein